MPVNRSSASEKILISDLSGGKVNASYNFERNDSVVSIKPASSLQHLSQYKIQMLPGLLASSNASLQAGQDIAFATSIDSSRKFPALSDAALLDTIQKRTFKYFWDYGHPVSGLARERSNATPETVTSGGSGFGIMAIVVGIDRGFITKAQGLNRMQTIVSFLKNKAQKFHGAFPHWLNGSTGEVIPFSQNDNGADLVETSFLMMGLLTARQYFNSTDAAEVSLIKDINSLWNAVEWNWFRQNNQDVLYWHWSPTASWAINLKIQGWNECLVTYVLGASSTTHSIPKTAYDIGFARNGE
nr:hypothetical protein [Niabella ginsengisoli]